MVSVDRQDNLSAAVGILVGLGLSLVLWVLVGWGVSSILGLRLSLVLSLAWRHVLSWVLG